MNQDLTVGRAERVLWRFCLPLFGSIVFQQLYNIADSLVAGKFIGENALAAVGNSYEVTLIFIAFAFGCNIGCSVVVSRYFGARDYVRLKTTVSTTWIAGGILCAVLMLLGWVFCNPLLAAMNTPGETWADSCLYLSVYIRGLPVESFYSIAGGIFSALGDSRTPFLFLAASSTSNVAVDILFVTVFDMGVAGVAWATFLCQGVSCVVAMLFVLRRLNGISTEESAPKFSWLILKEISAVAIPSILQQSFISVGNIMIQSVINGFGTGVMAGYSAAVKLNNLVITSFTTLGNGISNFTAQNLGAQKPGRVKEGFRAGVKLVWMLSVPLVLVYFLFGRQLLYLFMDEPTALAMQSGILYLPILAPFYFVISAKLVADGILKGSGMMNRFMVATVTDLILRVGFATVLSRTALGYIGIWCAWPVGWCAAAVLSIGFYRHRSWES